VIVAFSQLRREAPIPHVTNLRRDRNARFKVQLLLNAIVLMGHRKIKA
jgi:hypothetical protein